MAKQKKIAIVILNWNGEKLFETFLPSIIEHSSKTGAEIIVADNASTDQSIKLLSEKFPEIKIIELESNYGFAEGYNRALEQVKADYFVLVNSDVKVAENWIEPCINKFEADKNLAAIQPKILSYNEPLNFEYAGAAGGFIDSLVTRFAGKSFKSGGRRQRPYDQPGPIFWASGACMFVRADAFRKSGGFDGDFWAHMEEIDLCWRLKSQGYKIVYEPLSVVYHLGGGTLSYGSPRKIYLNFRNNLGCYIKIYLATNSNEYLSSV